MVKRATIAGIGILLLALLLLALYWYNKPRTEIVKLKVDFDMTAVALYDDYIQNEVNADKKYLDKIISVTGNVVGVQQQQGTVIQLQAGNEMGGVNCRLVGQDKIDTTGMIKRQITLKGRCTGFLMDVNLVDCTILPSKK